MSVQKRDMDEGSYGMIIMMRMRFSFFFGYCCRRNQKSIHKKFLSVRLFSTIHLKDFGESTVDIDIHLNLILNTEYICYLFGAFYRRITCLCSYFTRLSIFSISFTFGTVCYFIHAFYTFAFLLFVN